MALGKPIAMYKAKKGELAKVTGTYVKGKKMVFKFSRKYKQKKKFSQWKLGQEKPFFIQFVSEQDRE